MSRTRVRRRRIAATVCGVALASLLSAPVAGALGRGWDVVDTRVRRAVSPERVYVVRAGDTVWTIAERIAGADDPRAWVDAIAARNGIDAGALVPGQSIVLPRVA